MTTKTQLITALEDFNDGFITEEDLHAIIDKTPLDVILEVEESGFIIC